MSAAQRGHRTALSHRHERGRGPRRRTRARIDARALCPRRWWPPCPRTSPSSRPRPTRHRAGAVSVPRQRQDLGGRRRHLHPARGRRRPDGRLHRALVPGRHGSADPHPAGPQPDRRRAAAHRRRALHPARPPAGRAPGQPSARLLRLAPGTAYSSLTDGPDDGRAAEAVRVGAQDHLFRGTRSTPRGISRASATRSSASAPTSRSASSPRPGCGAGERRGWSAACCRPRCSRARACGSPPATARAAAARCSAATSTTRSGRPTARCTP